ncbi:META domain-containing protein [Marinobacter sp. ELB17]|uniref:META domain-containing protein n=1 Tax=Marinobacter sp. ELB17 TaxID=270374 RepID=UPI000A0767F4
MGCGGFGRQRHYRQLAYQQRLHEWKLGSPSCNRYSGEYQLSGSGFTVGDNMASTRMACPPALMNQEDYFLKLLMNVG